MTSLEDDECRMGSAWRAGQDENPIDAIMWPLGEWFCSFDDLPASERKPSRRAIMTRAQMAGDRL